MERSDIDTRAAGIGGVSVAVLGAIAMLWAGELLLLSVLLLLIAFLGGAISGSRTRSGHSSVITGAAGAVAGYLLAMPVGVWGLLAANAAVDGASVADPSSLGMTLAVVFPAALGLPVLLVGFAGYLGATIAELVTEPTAGSDDGHRYFE